MYLCIPDGGIVDYDGEDTSEQLDDLGNDLDILADESENHD